jgi:hypothetical protein
MQEWLMSSSQNQSPPRLLQTPITIPHPSTDGKHDHHMPRRLVQRKTTCNNPPTYQQQWSHCKPAPTHQLSLPRPMHYRMGHFLRGRIAKTWRRAIAHYYYERWPGIHFNPALWARKTIDLVWTTFQTIWLCRNGKLYGKDYDKQRAIALRTTRQSVKQIYEQSKGQVPKTNSNTLHAQPIEAVMQWTKHHLDAYLATAKVYLEQNVDPGLSTQVLASQLKWLRLQGGVW